MAAHGAGLWFMMPWTCAALRPALAAPALLLLMLVLSGCAELVDADQSRLCRQVLPVLNPPGTDIRITRSGPGTGPGTVRIVYRAEPPRQPARTRFVACRFAGALLARGRQELIGVETEAGALPTASLLFLRRFYLGSGEPLEDPGGLAATPGLPNVPHGVAYGAQQLIGALPQAAVYGLVAAAYSLVYGLAGRIVLGFGEFAALGGYGALLGVTLLVQGGGGALAGLGVGLLAALWAAGLHGAVVGRLVVAPLVRGPPLPALIATTGLMLALAEYQRIAQGNDLRWVPPVLNAPVALLRSGDFITTVTPVGLAVTGVALVAGASLSALMRLSAFGRAWRALADDPGAAALCGVDARRMFLATFGLAAGLAGLAGFVMTAYWGGVGYGAGLTLGLKALVAAVLGGIGSVGGGFLGGILIGLMEAAWSATMPIESRDIAVFALLSIVLALRPGGLFGWRDGGPRRV